MFLYHPIGKTLLEVHKDCGSHPKGFSVFVLQDEKDTTGAWLGEDFSVGLIINKHPECANYRVKYTNNFFGTTVLRVIKEGVEK